MFSSTFSLVFIAFILFIGHGQLATIQQTMANVNPLTSHILDTTLGKPAVNVKCTLYKLSEVGNLWTNIIEQHTNADGRIGNLISAEQFTTGVYKLHFDTKSYYEQQGLDTFYPYVEIVFQIKNPAEHYHVPILLTNYGYTTYRGS